MNMTRKKQQVQNAISLLSHLSPSDTTTTLHKQSIRRWFGLVLTCEHGDRIIHSYRTK